MWVPLPPPPHPQRELMIIVIDLQPVVVWLEGRGLDIMKLRRLGEEGRRKGGRVELILMWWKWIHKESGVRLWSTMLRNLCLQSKYVSMFHRMKVLSREKTSQFICKSKLKKVDGRNSNFWFLTPSNSLKLKALVKGALFEPRPPS